MVKVVGNIPLSVDGLFHRLFWYVKVVGMEWARREFVLSSLGLVIRYFVASLIRIVFRIPVMK